MQIFLQPRGVVFAHLVKTKQKALYVIPIVHNTLIVHCCYDAKLLCDIGTKANIR